MDKERIKRFYKVNHLSVEEISKKVGFPVEEIEKVIFGEVAPSEDEVIEEQNKVVESPQEVVEEQEPEVPEEVEETQTESEQESESEEKGE